MQRVEYNRAMNGYNYTVILEREESGGYHAFCPALRGCHAQGDSYEEAIQNVTEAIQLYIESLKARSEPIPSEDMIIKPIHLAACPV
jgi:predicted RNase H-like HicB family nuclease